MQDDEIDNTSFSLQRLPTKGIHVLTNSDSEGGESEINWAIPKENIQEMINESLQENEKAIRVILEERIKQEVDSVTNIIDTKFISLIETTKSTLTDKITKQQTTFEEEIAKILDKMANNLKDQKSYEQKITGRSI